jgi:hypothetical protein
MKSDSENDLPLDFLAEPNVVTQEMPTTSKDTSASTATPTTPKSRKRKARKVPTSPSSASTSSSSSEEDERKHRRKKSKRTKRQLPNKTIRRIIVSDPRSEDCNCSCKRKVAEMMSTIAKIKTSLRRNYCSNCAKAGHSTETCRRKRPNPFDLD